MFAVNKRLILSIMFFILTMLLITTLRPPILFNQNDGTIKEFGIGETKTIYSLGVFVVTICILVFYLFSMIDLMYN
uniref:Uncharacterized protein n=1 Tax=Pyramimonas orientalis virus TaxID=455367 RepID=A0A7M3UNZ2_POV01|nr:hypothetical protein HWQ62_00305 [Pyramimonas orientalis virus]